MGKEDPWYDTHDPAKAARGASWRLAVAFFVLLAFVAAVGGVIWALKVATSGVKGAGDQVRITNDGRNRVNAQEWFEGQFELIKATDRKLTLAAADKAAQPRDAFAATNYTGLVNRCQDIVAAYNAEANKVSRAAWRSLSLPAQIDNNDPATDCKEGAR